MTREQLLRLLPRTVLVLGGVSFLNDAASEMITPLLPVFLTATLGAGPAVVGLIEGVAEATASLLKLVAGWLADRGWPRKGLVVSGYGVSNLARPLIGFAFGWAWVLALRFLDRVGKGLRTAPRDALIAAAVPAAHRGGAFGFQRAMDHAGAVLGPLAAFALLQSGAELRHVFMLSVVPGALVLLLLVFGLERPEPMPPVARAPLRWRALDHRVRALILAAGGLALATAPEAFLVLWSESHGLQVAWVPLIWAAAHAVKTLLAGPAGALSDRLGRLPVVVVGWGLRIAVLLAMAVPGDGPAWVWGLFLAYAGAIALTEGAERALIGDWVPDAQKGTAFGLYHLCTGLLALPGALLFGVVWQQVTMGAAFMLAAALTAVAAAALVVLARGRPAR